MTTVSRLPLESVPGVLREAINLCHLVVNGFYVDKDLNFEAEAVLLREQASNLSGRIGRASPETDAAWKFGLEAAEIAKRYRQFKQVFRARTCGEPIPLLELAGPNGPSMIQRVGQLIAEKQDGKREFEFAHIWELPPGTKVQDPRHRQQALRIRIFSPPEHNEHLLQLKFDEEWFIPTGRIPLFDFLLQNMAKRLEQGHVHAHAEDRYQLFARLIPAPTSTVLAVVQDLAAEVRQSCSPQTDQARLKLGGEFELMNHWRGIPGVEVSDYGAY